LIAGDIDPWIMIIPHELTCVLRGAGKAGEGKYIYRIDVHIDIVQRNTRFQVGQARSETAAQYETETMTYMSV
jgi:hypothetical protein